MIVTIVGRKPITPEKKLLIIKLLIINILVFKGTIIFAAKKTWGGGGSLMLFGLCLGLTLQKRCSPSINGSDAYESCETK